MDRNRKVGVRRRRRAGHVRRLLRGTKVRPRLTVFRSNNHISAQVIDDEIGRTLVAASTQQKDVADGLASTGNKEAAEKVGRVLAERAKAVGIEKVAFDRGYYKYHGRVAALADGARKAGLNF